jgi:hypothetical protein
VAEGVGARENWRPRFHSSGGLKICYIGAMSESPDRLELVLKRQAGLDRQMDSLTASIQSLTRLFELQFRDVHQRLDGIEKLVRGYAAEQIGMANQIVNAQQRADQAHKRLDENAV